MKQNPDSYLLYEAGKFITYNIRIKIVMKHRVNGEALEKAAQTAFKRFPYYAKKINILPNGEIELKHNDAPICVTVTDGKHPRFGSKELNYHLCSIDYSDLLDSVCFFVVWRRKWQFTFFGQRIIGIVRLKCSADRPGERA